MEKTDEQLIAEHLNGDETALSVLIANNLKPIYNYIYRIIGNAKDAEDISQETFVKLWQSIRKYKHGQNFKAWLFRIARNTTIDHLRKRKNIVFSDLENDDEENNVSEKFTDPEPLSDELAAKAEDKKILNNLINKLPLKYQEVLTLYYTEDLTFNEIGDITDMPINTIKSRHRRALSALRRLLDESPASA